MKRLFLSCQILFFLTGALWGDYPRIGALKPSDILFRQLQSDIAAHYRAQGFGKGGTYPGLAFFSYIRASEDTMFTLAARLNLPYESIATINGLSQAQEFGVCHEIVIPNSPGIFVPDDPANPLEEIMASWRAGQGQLGERIVVNHDGRERSGVFLRGEKFHTVERAYFLKIIFLFPINRARITSSFGPRSDPFSGHPSFHNGIDLAAPVGSMVQAVGDGVVREAGYNDVLGKFVRISHHGGYETLYGHLKTAYVKPGDQLKAGSALGAVGMTGRTTGPHLHFELLKNGKRIDPSSLLP